VQQTNSDILVLMDEKKKKALTIKLTASEAEWLLNKLERIVIEARELAKRGGGPSAIEQKCKAESLQDRIRSEQ
jgi:hypothetical protein